VWHWYKDPADIPTGIDGGTMLNTSSLTAPRER
jgi:hypothetical protein